MCPPVLLTSQPALMDERWVSAVTSAVSIASLDRIELLLSLRDLVAVSTATVLTALRHSASLVPHCVYPTVEATDWDLIQVFFAYSDSEQCSEPLGPSSSFLFPCSPLPHNSSTLTSFCLFPCRCVQAFQNADNIRVLLGASAAAPDQVRAAVLSLYHRRLVVPALSRSLTRTCCVYAFAYLVYAPMLLSARSVHCADMLYGWRWHCVLDCWRCVGVAASSI
jgi:hypothetical protein